MSQVRQSNSPQHVHTCERVTAQCQIAQTGYQTNELLCSSLLISCQSFPVGLRFCRGGITSTLTHLQLRESTHLRSLNHLTHPLLGSWLLSIPRWQIGTWKLFLCSIFLNSLQLFIFYFLFFYCYVLLYHWLICPDLCSTPQSSAAPGVSVLLSASTLLLREGGGLRKTMGFTSNTYIFLSFPPLAATAVTMAHHEGVFSLT